MPGIRVLPRMYQQSILDLWTSDQILEAMDVFVSMLTDFGTIKGARFIFKKQNDLKLRELLEKVPEEKLQPISFQCKGYNRPKIYTAEWTLGG
jgi:hypothetical protein